MNAHHMQNPSEFISPIIPHKLQKYNNGDHISFIFWKGEEKFF